MSEPVLLIKSPRMPASYDEVADSLYTRAVQAAFRHAFHEAVIGFTRRAHEPTRGTVLQNKAADRYDTSLTDLRRKRDEAIGEIYGLCSVLNQHYPLTADESPDAETHTANPWKDEVDRAVKHLMRNLYLEHALDFVATLTPKER